MNIDGSRARTLWQWRPETDNWSRIISSARRISNGNTMVGFGYPKNQAIGSTGPIEVFEVTASGKPVWHMTVGGAVKSMYRAISIEVL